MDATIDNVGRLVIPKPLRDRLGLGPGSVVDISVYGSGIQISPGGRTALLVEVDGKLLARSSTPVTDADVLDAIDAGRR